jgi:hypothetical protein
MGHCWYRTHEDSLNCTHSFLPCVGMYVTFNTLCVCKFLKICPGAGVRTIKNEEIG